MGSAALDRLTDSSTVRVLSAPHRGPRASKVAGLSGDEVAVAVRKVNEGAVGDFRARHLIRWYNEGADGRIPWGAPGDFDACVRVAAEHMAPGRAKGFCANRHHDALGIWPATHAARERGKSARAGEPDEAVEALLAAMERIRSLGLEKSWDPAKHPRIPAGAPGGGQFMSLGDVLHGKLKEHLHDGGHGDPFEGFSREQLRRTARRRGVELRRGASRDEIAAALLRNLHGSGHESDRAEDALSADRPSKPKAAELLDASKKGAEGPIGVRSATEEDAARAGQEIFGGVFAGIPVRVNRADIHPDGSVTFHGTVGEGQYLGRFERRIGTDRDGKLFADHQLLMLRPSVQGQRFAQEFNANAERWYRENGFDRIQLLADMDVGSYAWSRSGYDFANPTARRAVLGDLRGKVYDYQIRIAESTDPDERAALQAQVDAAKALLKRSRTETITAYEIGQVGRPPGATGRDAQWIGKDALLGSIWKGVKWLTPATT